jgi:predicted nucleotide-binding protein (sugar kinase/HSP70/actin superfamily)
MGIKEVWQSMQPKFQRAKFSDDYKYIIDSYGNKVRAGDPRVTHIWPYGGNGARMVENVFLKRGWQIRSCWTEMSDAIQFSHRLSAGRGCNTFNYLTGSYYKDLLEHPENNSISVYWGLDQEGPCQCGGWPDVWGVITERLSLPNRIFGPLVSLNNHSLGQGINFGMEFLMAIMLGDFFDEIENTLKVAAREAETALLIFAQERDRVALALQSNAWLLRAALKNAAHNLSMISLKEQVEQLPRVLIFGGGAVSIVHEPVTTYFIRQGIIPKVVDSAEFSMYLLSEPLRRFGYKRDIASFNKQENIILMLGALLHFKYSPKEVFTAINSAAAIQIADLIGTNFHQILHTSGLLFNRWTPYGTIMEKSEPHLNPYVYCESGVALGRYLTSLEHSDFDGLLHIAMFNCQRSISIQPILRTFSISSSVPFSGLELDGNQLTVNQYRLLETLAFQAKRFRESKKSIPKSATSFLS